MNFYYDKKIFWKTVILIQLLVVPFVILLHLTTEFRIIELILWLFYTFLGSVCISSYLDKESLVKHLSIYKDFQLIYTGGKGHYFYVGITVLLYFLAWIVVFTEGKMNFFGGLFLFPILFTLEIERRVLIADSKIYYMGRVVLINEDTKIRLLNKKIEVKDINGDVIEIGATNKDIAKGIYDRLQGLVLKG